MGFHTHPSAHVLRVFLFATQGLLFALALIAANSAFNDTLEELFASKRDQAIAAWVVLGVSALLAVFFYLLFHHLSNKYDQERLAAAGRFIPIPSRASTGPAISDSNYDSGDEQDEPLDEERGSKGMLNHLGNHFIPHTLGGLAAADSHTRQRRPACHSTSVDLSELQQLQQQQAGGSYGHTPDSGFSGAVSRRIPIVC